MKGWMRPALGGRWGPVAALVFGMALLPAATTAPRKVPPGEPETEAEAHYELGVIYHEQIFENLDKAIAEYEKAVRLKPDFANAHFNLALSYHTKGKLGTDDRELYKKALKEYRLYLKYSPKGDLAAKAKQNIRALELRLR